MAEMILLPIDRHPLWLAHLHNTAMIGNGDQYKETQTRLFVRIKPNEKERSTYTYLKDVEEVFIVYGPQTR